MNGKMLVPSMILILIAAILLGIGRAGTLGSGATLNGARWLAASLVVVGLIYPFLTRALLGRKRG